MKPRLLHIGQRKTGTTWLQFIAERAAEAGKLELQHWDIARWDKRHPIPRDISDENLAEFAALLSQTTEIPVFATQERLILLDPARLARAVAKVWPQMQILITTRAPQDYLLSSFNNSSMSGRFQTTTDFAKGFTRTHIRISHNLDLIAQEFGALFGAENVHFLPYELLRDDNAAFLRAVSALLDTDLSPFAVSQPINKSPPPVYLELQRRLNHLVAEMAPELPQQLIWRHFMRFANFSAGSAVGLEQYFRDFAAQEPSLADFVPDLPVLPDGALADLASRMRVLAPLPLYAPYLAEYGLELP